MPLCYRCAAPAAALFLVVIIVQSAVMMNTFDRLSALEAAVGDKGAAASAPAVLPTSTGGAHRALQASQCYSTDVRRPRPPRHLIFYLLRYRHLFSTCYSPRESSCAGIVRG